jgi:hypothetical protein
MGHFSQTFGIKKEKIALLEAGELHTLFPVTGTTF